jgi:hypothetical protein
MRVIFGTSFSVVSGGFLMIFLDKKHQAVFKQLIGNRFDTFAAVLVGPLPKITKTVF